MKSTIQSNNNMAADLRNYFMKVIDETKFETSELIKKTENRSNQFEAQIKNILLEQEHFAAEMDQTRQARSRMQGAIDSMMKKLHDFDESKADLTSLQQCEKQMEV